MYTLVSTATAAHYNWGDNCDGWVLANSDPLLIIEEFMPAGTAEQRHYHSRARQFFYVLDGWLTMEIEGHLYKVPARQGIEIPPLVSHQARNDERSGVTFLVISTPTSRGDRTIAPPNQDQIT